MNYCHICCEKSFFSIDIYKLTNWLKHLNVKRLKYDTIKKYLCELKSHDININYTFQNTEIFAHFIFKRICINIKRRQNETNKRKRHSIIKNILFKLFKRLNINVRNDVNLHATFCLIFVHFFKIDEFIYNQINVKIKNFNDWFIIKNFVHLQKNNFILKLFYSKTNTFNRDISIHITTFNDDIYSIKLLCHLFD